MGFGTIVSLKIREMTGIKGGERGREREEVRKGEVGREKERETEVCVCECQRANVTSKYTENYYYLIVR